MRPVLARRAPPCPSRAPLLECPMLQRLMHGMRASALVTYQAQIGGPCALLMSHIPGKRCSKHLRSVPQEGSTCSARSWPLASF